MTPTRIERYSYKESGRSQFGNTKKPDCHEIVLCNENPLMQCKHHSTLRTSWKSDQSVFYRHQVIQICLKLSHQSQFRRFVGQNLDYDYFSHKAASASHFSYLEHTPLLFALASSQRARRRDDVVCAVEVSRAGGQRSEGVREGAWMAEAGEA